MKYVEWEKIIRGGITLGRSETAQDWKNDFSVRSLRIYMLVRVFYIFKNRKFPEKEDNVTGSFFRSQQKNSSQIA